MGSIRIVDTKLKGLKEIHPFSAEDERGKLIKTYEKQQYFTYGLDFDTSEIMFSTSHKGVLRGLHFQTKVPQAKIVSVIKGEVWDVAVDLRKGSETCGQWFGAYLSENNKALYIPAGFAHGFLALKEDTILMYQCENPYLKEEDTGILWSDSDLKIQWPIDRVNHFIVSKRDQNFGGFLDFMNQHGGL